MAKKSSASFRRGAPTRMSSEDIKNRQWTELDRQALRRASEAQARGDEVGIDYSDIPQLTDAQLSHLVRLRGSRRKVAVSVRLDPDVLDWLRSKGDGHLTRINDILTNLMEAERAGGSAGR